jgi:hypothetical protein
MSDTTTSQARMDALIDGHFRAEELRDPDAIVDGFIPGAEHDTGDPDGPRYGGEAIANFYRELFAELRIDRFATLKRLYGDRHAVDESILHATAIGRPFGFEGRGRAVTVRLLHVFEFADGLISRENAWLDMAGMAAQLS